jgi:hypothetical protein
LLALVPVAYLLVAKMVLSRGPRNATRNQGQVSSRGGKR